MKNAAIDKVLEIVRTHLYEQPTNNVSGGKIAGTVEAGDDPPVRKKKRQIDSERQMERNIERVREIDIERQKEREKDRGCPKRQ